MAGLDEALKEQEKRAAQTEAAEKASAPSANELALWRGYSVQALMSRFGRPYAATITEGNVICATWYACTYPAATYVYYTSEGWTSYVQTRNGVVTDVSTVYYIVPHSPGANLNGKVFIPR